MLLMQLKRNGGGGGSLRWPWRHSCLSLVSPSFERALLTSARQGQQISKTTVAAAAKNGYYLTRALFAGNFPPPSRFLAKRYNPKGFTGQSGSNRLMFTGISGGGKFVNKFLVANKINGRQKGLILVGLLAAASGLAAVVLFTQPDASRQVNEWLQNMEETVGLRKQNRSAWARSGGGDGGGSGAGGYSPGDDNRQHDGGQLTWTDFLQRVVPTGKIVKIQFIAKPEVLIAHVRENNGLETQYTVRVPDSGTYEHEIRKTEIGAGLAPQQWAHIVVVEPSPWTGLIIGGLIFGFLLLPLIIEVMKKRSPGGEGKGFNLFDMISETMSQRIKVIDPADKNGKLKTKFRHVAGLHEAKQEIKEFVDYLKNPAKFTRLGARLPKGALLTGPPGCGKTLLAKALAAESSVPFLSINGTEFMEMIGGLGARRVRNLFKMAKTRAPCIIFIDEIDTIGGRRRDGRETTTGFSEEEYTLNQLLVELDGIDSGSQGVVVIGSTNRADVLDKALLRPGRFDRHISVDLPTLLERAELFTLYLRGVKTENRVLGMAPVLAQLTTGFSGADINNVVNEAAIRAAGQGKKMVTSEELDFALNKIIGGAEKKSRTLVEEERHTVAVHEAGHALVGWLLEHTDALLKVTIIPRTTAALGFAQYTPRDRKLYTKEELFDRICMMLGGRVAENVVFGRITTGAQNDLEKVRKQAYAMTRVYGMSTAVGPLSFGGGQSGGQSEDGESGSSSEEFQKKPYSRKLAALIDQEVSRLVREAQAKTDELLRVNRGKLDTIAKALLAREVLTYQDVRKLIGPPTFGEKHTVDLADTVVEPDEQP